MDNTRILNVKDTQNDGSTVVYFMYRDQRVADNHALLAAQNEAIRRNGPLIVLFNLENVLGRTKEQYAFMLNGLEEMAAELKYKHIRFILSEGDPVQNILSALKVFDAGAIYFDFNPLRHSRSLVKDIARRFEGSVKVIDTHNVIPVWITSDKKEVAAYTIRNKIHKNLERYTVEPAHIKTHPVASEHAFESMSFAQAKEFIAAIPSINTKIDATPGSVAAHSALRSFLDNGLEDYADKRNDITQDAQSGLSPYLHFGQISSLRVLLETIKRIDDRPLLFDEPTMAKTGSGSSLKSGANALIEELIVRKELADNFCLYDQDYDDIKAAPEWAIKSLDDHSGDPREFIYTFDEWEHAKTHDPAWNAAQNQLRSTGKIHGYMRMYWAKKMLEWSPDPKTALRDCIRLNDMYSIDGGDPNGYANILWSIAGLHDRPWTERAIFGKVRYMNIGGLKRKFDLDTYLLRWNDEQQTLDF